MEIRPIVSALLRSKVSLVLIGLQIALTLAIVCNSLFIISERLALMQRPSGMSEADTFGIGSLGFGPGFDVKTSVAEDLAALRGMPGVLDATAINSVPMRNGGWGESIFLTPEQKTQTAGTAIYAVDEHGLDTLGVTLIGGRGFRADEVTTRDPGESEWPSGIIITRALGEKLFPGQNPVGKQFYLNQKAPPNTVIGVVDRLQSPWVHQKERVEFSTLVPQYLVGGSKFAFYLVRARPGQRDLLMKQVEAKLGEINHSRIVRDARSIESIRTKGYAEDHAMTLILAIVIVSLLIITALGIVGMASFWVTQRTKQIGTRRALGATRGSILRYFLAENFLITSLGLAVGALLAYGFNVWLISNYEARQMPWFYVPVGCLSLWALGQIAVLGPARRASRVPPAMATRSV